MSDELRKEGWRVTEIGIDCIAPSEVQYLIELVKGSATGKARIKIQNGDQIWYMVATFIKDEGWHTPLGYFKELDPNTCGYHLKRKIGA